MSDARRVMITFSDTRMPDYGEWDEQQFGRYALLPWEEYAAKDAVVEAAEVAKTQYDDWRAGKIPPGPMWRSLTDVFDALRALDAAKGGDDE